MVKTLTKTNLFGVPSLETVRAIDDMDVAQAVGAAHFRLAARMRELELSFEAKASELRAAFRAEVTAALGAEE